MSIPQTVLEYVQALKWPAIVGGIAFLFRRAIKKALENFRMPEEGSVKLTGLGDVAWKTKMSQVAAGAEEVGSASSAAPSRPDVDIGRATEQAVMWLDVVDSWESVERAVLIDPIGAILGTWERLEATILQRFTDPEKPSNGIPVVHSFISNLPVPEEVIGLVISLKDLRDRAFYNSLLIEPLDALRYMQSAKRAISTLLEFSPY